MPAYDYWCENCQQGQEVRKPMTLAETDEYCPDCQHRMRRRYHAVATTWGTNCWGWDSEDMGDVPTLRHKA